MKKSMAMVNFSYMDTQKLIEMTAVFVREKLEGDGSGHDWWHIDRVWRLAKRLQATEGGDLVIVELAALLHDIADWKFYGGDLEAGPKAAREWLESFGVESVITDHICQIVRDISFKGAGVATSMPTIEGQVVQDADRLDAIGAIGIARTFAYGGSKNREMYNPEKSPENHENFEQYKRSQGATINHFYEKLLLLKDRMNTDSARKIAQDRHEFMERYLKQFYAEWAEEDGVKITYNKLVRDLIPEIIQSKGQTAKIHRADDVEFRYKLHQKLNEECQEFLLEPSQEELADIFEVVRALCDLHGWMLPEIEQVRQKKLADRGGFVKRIILEEV